MMTEGIQQIGHDRLLKVLQDARSELSPELGLSTLTETDFIQSLRMNNASYLKPHQLQRFV